MSAVAESKGIKIVAKNSKAHHDYFIEEKYEAGIELAGTEVKSIRQGHVNLKDSFCIVKDGQMSVIGMHISPYEKGNIFNKDPLRQRRPSPASSRTGTPSSPCPSTSAAPGSSWRSAWPRAKSSMTSGRRRPGRTPSGRWTGP